MDNNDPAQRGEAALKRLYANALASNFKHANTLAAISKGETMMMTSAYGRMVVHCSLERIENGYLVRSAQREGEVTKVYFAPDLKAAGEQITALAVSYDLNGEGYVDKQA